MCGVQPPSAGHSVSALLARFPNQLALPHELVPVDTTRPALGVAYCNWSLETFFTVSLGPAAGLAPLLHPTDEFLFAPLFLPASALLRPKEACCLFRSVTGVFNLSIGYKKIDDCLSKPEHRTWWAR